MTATQIVAISIFILMFGLIITERIERHYVTLAGGLATLIVVFGICMRDMDAIIHVLNYKSIFTLDFWYHAGESAAESSAGINWETIIFILGMMIMGNLHRSQ